ncbi:MAG: hypothetical protein KBB94_10165 [Legionellaceae bacterium]|nr:hypothetical protein [Legionellaceae bacterium]MBP9775990.1 hypothetical protein [Legionellaceae bacterium]
MLQRGFKKMLVGGLLLWTGSVLAGEVGYIKHQFINNTSNECYVSVHQQYSYPIDACLGTVAAKETKICDGAFEPHQPNFFIYAICNGSAQRLELNKMVFLRNTYKSQNIEVIWTIDMAKKKLRVGYREHGF